MNPSEQPINPSFFDDNQIQDYKMWKKNIPLKKPSDVRIMEGILFKRSNRTNFWKSRFYVLFEDRLAYYKNGRDKNEQGYCLILNMRIERIPQQSEKDDKYGIRFIHNKQVSELYARAKEVQDKWIQKLLNFCVQTTYSSLYVNMKTIGKGSFAKVYLSRRKSDNADFAVKTFDKALLGNADKAKASLINEINIMRKLDHENIIKLFEVYESDHFIYLVVELLHGGELFERIVKKGQYSERDACTLMRKLLSALEYLHGKGIMHRDLKPENLILKSQENDWDIKIADFGLAASVAGEHLFKRCGTPGYVAPEVLADEKYDQKVDLFSAGVILYILLTGGSPFHGKSYNEILWKNKNCEINFNFSELGHKISNSAIDLMQKMLYKDPKERISAGDALNHEWFQFSGEFLSPKSQAPIYLSSAQENMKRFQENNRFNVKNIKPKDLNLERAQHAPSPLINGNLTGLVDSKNHVALNSPDIRIGTPSSKRSSKFTTRPHDTIEESDDVDLVSDERTIINQNIKQYQGNGIFFGKMMRTDVNKNMNGDVKQPEANAKTIKKAINVQSNLLKILGGGMPQSTPRNNTGNGISLPTDKPSNMESGPESQDKNKAKVNSITNNLKQLI